ncbi:MAG: hypothetical protein IKO35_06420 [Elusimicrobiaceae bacterium]|nr:hypothetical protein [Elusimicrobiaceae bacterium]
MQKVNLFGVYHFGSGNIAFLIQGIEISFFFFDTAFFNFFRFAAFFAADVTMSRAERFPLKSS